MNDSLRSRAVAMLKTSLEDAERIPAEEMPKLLHELRAHQMELEIQNEELRLAQIQLADSRDRYSDLYDFAPVGYLTLDKQGVIQQANLTAATMLNVQRAHLAGRKFSDFVSDQSQDTWHLHRREVFANAKTTACELKMIAYDGVSKSFGLQSLAFPDDQGKLNQCRTALTEVSERRMAFDALSQLNINWDESLSDTSYQLDRSIEQLRLLSEAVAHLGEGVMITSDNIDWPGPEIIFVNHAMCRITGYEAHELIGKSPRILQGKATSIEALAQVHHDLIAAGTSVVELVNYRKDGTPYDVEIFITPLFDTNGKRTNFVSIQRDVTERKRVEKDLRREHEFNRSIVNTSQNIMLVLDANARIVQFNPYLEKVTGWRFDEVRGCNWFERFLPEVDRTATRQLFELSLAGNWTKGNANPILTKNGEQRHIEWHNTPLTDPSGRLMGLLCTGQDVTERRELERNILDIASEERRRIGTNLHADRWMWLMRDGIAHDGLDFHSFQVLNGCPL